MNFRRRVGSGTGKGHYLYSLPTKNSKERFQYNHECITNDWVMTCAIHIYRSNCDDLQQPDRVVRVQGCDGGLNLDVTIKHTFGASNHHTFAAVVHLVGGFNPSEKY